jgi:hypothetical protein
MRTARRRKALVVFYAIRYSFTQLAYGIRLFRFEAVENVRGTSNPCIRSFVPLVCSLHIL